MLNLDVETSSPLNICPTLTCKICISLILLGILKLKEGEMWAILFLQSTMTGEIIWNSKDVMPCVGPGETWIYKGVSPCNSQVKLTVTP